MELALQTYMDSQYQEWQEHMEKVFRSQDEMNANLVKRNPFATLVQTHIVPTNGIDLLPPFCRAGRHALD